MKKGAHFSAKGVAKMYGCQAAKKKKIGETFQKLDARYFCQGKLFWDTPVYTVQTVAADLRQGEHIPKMQNNIGRKSMLRVLRQLRGKDGGELGAVPCRAMPCRVTPRAARPGAAFCTTAVNLR